jgi:transglutaminase-like putative cysteine protease
MKYQINHTTRYHYTEAVPICHNEVRLTPRQESTQHCENSGLLIHPTPAQRNHRSDYFGNGVLSFSIQETHDTLTVTASSQVRITPAPLPNANASPAWETVAQALRSDRSPNGLRVCEFVFDSLHVQRRDWLAEYARQSFSPGRPICEAALHLSERIHQEFEYDPRATTVNTPLEEAFSQRRGVCQDFAHIQIGCLRSLGLAARYVSGYLRTLPPPGQPRLIGADASHAWLSLFCGELGWIDLDPTNNSIPSFDHISLAFGRDYSDVCPIKGVFVGGGQHGMTVSVDVAPLAE